MENMNEENEKGVWVVDDQLSDADEAILADVYKEFSKEGPILKQGEYFED